MNRAVIWILAIVVVIVAGVMFFKRGDKGQESVTDVKPGAAVAVSNPSTQTAQSLKHDPGVVVQAQETHQQMLNRKLSGLNLSPELRALLGISVGKADRNARRLALTRLTRTLSPDDVKALAFFVDFRHEDNPELPNAVFEALKNDAMAVLMSQKQVPEGLGTQLAGMFGDEKHSTRWRDYSLQYMARCYEEVLKPDSPEKATITNAYAVALSARSQKFAGTALMAVERLSRDHAEFDRRQIGDAAVGIALGNDTCEDSQITALRVCALMNRAEVLPQARILAQTGATMPVRLAAIATVGDLGDASDLEYIESLGGSDDKRLQRISKSASANLKKRLGGKVEPPKGG